MVIIWLKKLTEKVLFYDALSNVYHDVVVIASENERLYHLWKDRLETVLHDFSKPVENTYSFEMPLSFEVNILVQYQYPLVVTGVFCKCFVLYT